MENPCRQRSLAGYSPWDHKELGMTEQLTLAQFYFIHHLLILFARHTEPATIFSKNKTDKILAIVVVLKS